MIPVVIHIYTDNKGRRDDITAQAQAIYENMSFLQFDCNTQPSEQTVTAKVVDYQSRKYEPVTYPCRGGNCRIN